MSTRFPTRRPTRERISRLSRHPIQTIRSALKNRQEKKWQNYYAAAKMLGQSENNAKLFADQIVGRKVPSQITPEVKSFLKPLVKIMSERQEVKSKILELIDQKNALAYQLSHRTLSKLTRDKIAAQQRKLQHQIELLMEGRLPRIESRLKFLVASIVKK